MISQLLLLFAAFLQFLQPHTISTALAPIHLQIQLCNMATPSPHLIKIKFKWIGPPRIFDSAYYYNIFYTAINLDTSTYVSIRPATHNGAIEVFVDEVGIDSLYKVYEGLALDKFRKSHIEPLPSAELSNRATICIRDPPLPMSTEQELANIKNNTIIHRNCLLNNIKRVTAGKGRANLLYIEFAHLEHAKNALINLTILSKHIPQDTVSILQHIAIQQCSIRLQYSNVAQHCSTVLHHSNAAQHCITAM